MVNFLVKRLHLFTLIHFSLNHDQVEQHTATDISPLLNDLQILQASSCIPHVDV